MKAAMKKEWKQRCAGFWQARTPTEQRALRIMLVVILVALLAQLLWSLEQSRQRLRRQLPSIAAERESMRQNLAEWRVLEASAQARSALPASFQKEVNRRISALGSGVSSVWSGPAQLRLTGTVSFDSWVGWLGEMQQDFRLFVLRAQVTAAGPGMVRIEVDLANETVAP